MARTKKTVVSGITREQAEQAFADFAAADAKVQNLTSKMDIEMTRIRENICGSVGRAVCHQGKELRHHAGIRHRKQGRTILQAEKP